jgi:hypothetical protein
MWVLILCGAPIYLDCRPYLLIEVYRYRMLEQSGKLGQVQWLLTRRDMV